jgi:hypothetical protein
MTAAEPRRAVLRGIAAALAGALFAASAHQARAAETPLVGRPKGRPHIKVERVSLPPGVPNADEYLRHLNLTLRREARRADWGAGARNTIMLRFAVEKLTFEAHAASVRVHCSAMGELPRRRTARSQLVYGGDRADETKLVKQVLEIVARGVVARLADLERTRRGR